METPRKMKMSVSLTLLHIFRKYLMVVYDLWEMLASTYGLITTPQAINLFETRKMRKVGGEDVFIVLARRVRAYADKEDIHVKCRLYLRHDPRQVEGFCREVGHVAVEEDKQRLDDPSVGGETGGEGAHEAVDGAHHEASQ